MFKSLKLLFNKKNKDIRGKVGFTLLGLLIFMVGTTIPVPLPDEVKKKVFDLGFVELYDAIAGGALKNFSIFFKNFRKK